MPITDGTLQDTTTMSQYDEKDINQPGIDEHCFFTRYTLEHRLRRLDVTTLS